MMKPSTIPFRLSSLLRGAALALGLGLSAFGGPLSCAARQATMTTPAAADTFEVRLHRPATVGRRGRVTVDGEKHQSTRIHANGRDLPDRREDLQVHFRAVERVVSLGPTGDWLEAQFTVERLETEDAQGPHALLRPGQTVTVVRGAHSREARVTVDGQSVEAPVREALGVVLLMGTGSVTDDEIFGTSQRQAPGASWPVNSEVAQRDLARSADVTATITGQTRLHGRASVQGTDCLDLSAEMNGRVTALGNLPPSSVVRVGTFHATMRGMFPLDATARSLSGTNGMTMNLVVDLPPNAASDHNEIQVTVRESKAETFAPLQG